MKLKINFYLLDPTFYNNNKKKLYNFEIWPKEKNSKNYLLNFSFNIFKFFLLLILDKIQILFVFEEKNFFAEIILVESIF